MDDILAFRIIKEMVKHDWDADIEISDKDCMSIYDSYKRSGGLWENIISGDINSISLLTTVIEDFINMRNIAKKLSNQK